ncbi:hypothetical protein [Botrimarina sp.]|uniref:hypothetical protein n=1 Tax=Botrimarina sp. TaxID=2795802 RepID=UPI0032EAAF09
MRTGAGVWVSNNASGCCFAMGKVNNERRESSWLTVRQLADALDVSIDYVRREVLRRAPADMVRRDVRPMRVYGRGCIELALRGLLKPAEPLDLDPLFLDDE